METNKKDSFQFEVGKTYETQEGKFVEVLRRTDTKGYECLVCSDGIARYDRSNSNSDAGRVTGSPHDYSDLRNFKKKVTIHRTESFVIEFKDQETFAKFFNEMREKSFEKDGMMVKVFASGDLSDDLEKMEERVNDLEEKFDSI